MTQTTVKRTVVEAPPVVRRARTWPTVVGAWTPAAVALVWLGYAVVAGLPVGGAVVATLAVLVSQVLPGVLVWRAVRPRDGWWIEDLTMGFAIGAAIAVGVQTVAGLTGQRWIAIGAGPVLASVLLGLPGTQRRIVEARTAPLPAWWGPIVSLLSLAAVWQLEYYFRRVPIGWTDGARTMDVDSTFHLALAAELAHRGPGNFPWVLDEPLAYHWFSHAWVAQVSATSGAGLDAVLFRFMPAVLPLAVALGVGAAAVRLTGRFYPGPIAAAITMLMADVNVFGHVTLSEPIAPLSPSLGFSAVALIALVVVLGVRWQGEMHPAGLVLIALLALLAAGAKGSAAPLIVAGLGVAALGMAIFDRSQVRTVLLDLAVTTGCLLVVMFIVIRGSNAGLHFGSAESTAFFGWIGHLDGWLSGVFAFAVTLAMLLSRGVAAAVLPGIAGVRRQPISWLLLGGGLAGATAAVAFVHPGASQYYFARSGIPLLAIASAAGIVAMVSRLRRRVGYTVAIGVVAGPVMTLLLPLLFGRLGPENGVPHALLLLGTAAIVLAVAGLLAARLRLRGAIGAALAFTVIAGGIAIFPVSQWKLWSTPEPQPVLPTANLAVSRDQIDAARWIRDNSDAGDLVMTNRHCTAPVQPAGCDGRRFVVAAYSERQVLVEGWRYTTTANRLAGENESATVDYWKPDVLALNDVFIGRPTRQAADQLRALGVRWVYADHTRPRTASLQRYAELRFSNSTVDVYELR